MSDKERFLADFGAGGAAICHLVEGIRNITTSAGRRGGSMSGAAGALQSKRGDLAGLQC